MLYNKLLIIWQIDGTYPDGPDLMQVIKVVNTNFFFFIYLGKVFDALNMLINLFYVNLVAHTVKCVEN